MAFAFFKPTEKEGETITGYAYETRENGAPILVGAPAWVEARITDVV